MTEPDPTAVEWDGRESDPTALVMAVLNETDPIIAMVRERIAPDAEEPRR